MIESVWIDERDAVFLHDRLIALRGGPSEIRDQDILKSALARPRQDVADAVTLASLYTTAIIRDHPFVDGNKHTAFVIGILFLELNGHSFAASEAEAAQAVLALAAGDLDEASFAAFLAEHCTPTLE